MTDPLERVALAIFSYWRENPYSEVKSNVAWEKLDDRSKQPWIGCAALAVIAMRTLQTVALDANVIPEAPSDDEPQAMDSEMSALLATNDPTERPLQVGDKVRHVTGAKVVWGIMIDAALGE